jgi:ABC-type uncharacterized transport system involved in gliding motility auxiliary subunit
MARRQVLLQQLLSAVLFVGVLGMLAWLSNKYSVEADWTAGNRNTLTAPSRRLLDTLPEPIAFKVFVYPRSETRQAIEADVRRYQRVKANVTLEFIDPATHPEQVRAYNVQRDGEAVVEYQGRHESLSATTEQAITAALQRLAHSGERWVVFLEGHGERAIGDSEQQGLSEFATFLRDKGLKLRGLNLAIDPRVPDNTAVLVIAAPERPLLEGEVKLLGDYVQRGGNLLWLADPATGPRDPVASLDPLAKGLNVAWQKGTGILLESASLGLPPFVYITTQYPRNPVTHDFPENALFPLVRGLTYKSDPAGWNAEPLLTTSEHAWLETGKLEGELAMEPNKGDIAGPLTLGVTLTREVKPPAPAAPVAPVAPKAGEPPAAPEAGKPQRVALVGDSDFISNAYVGQLGNSLLGLNLVQWLASQDEQLNIDVPKAPDRSLVIPAWGMYGLYFGYLLLLPAALLGFGITRWVIRRRA